MPNETPTFSTQHESGPTADILPNTVRQPLRSRINGVWLLTNVAIGSAMMGASLKHRSVGLPYPLDFEEHGLHVLPAVAAGAAITASAELLSPRLNRSARFVGAGIVAITGVIYETRFGKPFWPARGNAFDIADMVYTATGGLAGAVTIQPRAKV